MPPKKSGKGGKRVGAGNRSKGGEQGNEATYEDRQEYDRRRKEKERGEGRGKTTATQVKCFKFDSNLHFNDNFLCDF